MQFSFQNDGKGNESIVLVGSKGQGIRLVPSAHATFNRLRDALLADPPLPDFTEEDAFALADATATIADTLTALSDRVHVKGDTVYFDGMAQESKLTRQIVDMVRNDDDNVTGYVRFLENLNDNPSAKSRKGLFKFIAKNGLTITRDGMFIGYKAVAEDGKSLSTGREDVTVTDTDGNVEVHKGRIPNPVGAVVSMARDLVDPDREQHCSVGLHVGTHNYANNFSTTGRFLTVAVNPRDAVETPNDDAEKIRVCRYTVLELNEGRKQYEGTSYVEDTTGLYDDEDYGYDPDDDYSPQHGGI